MKRIATALVLIPFVVWVVLGAPEWTFDIVLVAIGLIAYHEFDTIAAAHGIAKSGFAGMAAGLLFLFAPYPEAAITLIAVAAMVFALRFRDFKDALPAAAAFVLGVVYIFGAWRCARGLRAINPHWLMLALLVSWAGDTAAYYVGRALGRHKMAPHISPGKTWEGAIGSVGGGVLAAGVYEYFLIPSSPLLMVGVLAAIANVAGQVGDLCESAIKRGAGLKDSGTTLPGHGGWLDRIDSTLFSVPVIYAAVKLMER